MIIERDGKFYKQTIIEEEIDPVQEEYKLQAWKDALVNDASERAEYESKLAAIEGLKISDEYKRTLKESLSISSPSGIHQTLVDEQETKVQELNSLRYGDNI